MAVRCEPDPAEVHRAYALLGVPPGATDEELRAAYRELVRAWHPDRMPAGSARQRRAQEKLKAINAACELVIRLRHGGGREAENPGARTPAHAPWDWARETAASVAAGTMALTEELGWGRAMQLYHEGRAHFRAGRWTEAVSAFLQSVCLVQNNAEAHSLLGAAHRRLGNPAKAAAALHTAVRIAPDLAEAHLELGLACRGLGDAEGLRRAQMALDRLDEELAAVLRGGTSP